MVMKLIWHNYLVLSLGNCAHETSTETGLIKYIWFTFSSTGFARI